MEGLLRRSDAELAALNAATANKPHISTSLPPVEAPFLEQAASRLEDDELRARCLDLLLQLKQVNDHISEVQFFMRLTFTPGITNENHARAGRNEARHFSDVGKRARIAVEKLLAIEERLVSRRLRSPGGPENKQNERSRRRGGHPECAPSQLILGVRRLLLERGSRRPIVRRRWNPKMASAKDIARQILDSLPEDCTLQEIQYRLYVRPMVEEGREDVRGARVVAQEEIERDLERWLAQ